jgi:hypothetical protein
MGMPHIKIFKVYLKPYSLSQKSYVCIPRFLAEPLIMLYGILRVGGSLVVKHWRISQLYKTDHSRTCEYIQVKAKGSRNRPGVAQRVPGGLGSYIGAWRSVVVKALRY